MQHAYGCSRTLQHSSQRILNSPEDMDSHSWKNTQDIATVTKSVADGLVFFVQVTFSDIELFCHGGKY